MPADAVKSGAASSEHTRYENQLEIIIIIIIIHSPGYTPHKITFTHR